VVIESGATFSAYGGFLLDDGDLTIDGILVTGNFNVSWGYVFMRNEKALLKVNGDFSFSEWSDRFFEKGTIEISENLYLVKKHSSPLLRTDKEFNIKLVGDKEHTVEARSTSSLNLGQLYVEGTIKTTTGFTVGTLHNDLVLRGNRFIVDNLNGNDLTVIPLYDEPVDLDNITVGEDSTLTILGDFKLSNREIKLDGRMFVTGNFDANSNMSRVIMEKESSFLRIDGDMIFRGWREHSSFSKGVIEICGDLHEEHDTYEGHFYAGEGITVKFIGDKVHNIRSISNYTGLGNLYVEGALKSNNQLYIHSLLNDLNLYSNETANVINWNNKVMTIIPIDQEQVIDINRSSFDKCAKLYLSGDAEIVSSDTILNGTIDISGNLTVRNHGLIMTEESSRLIVQGNVNFHDYDTKGYLKKGLVEIGGNLYPSGEFQTGEDLIIKFIGNKEHAINRSYPNYPFGQLYVEGTIKTTNGFSVHTLCTNININGNLPYFSAENWNNKTIRLVGATEVPNFAIPADYKKIVIERIENGLTVYDVLIAPVNATSNITGNVTSYNPNNPIILSLSQNGIVQYTEVIAASAGIGQYSQLFSFENIMPGKYTLTVTKKANTLYTILDVEVNGNVNVGTLTLLCGDISGDGLINQSDLNILWLPANYNKSVTDSNANPLCDLNGDGLVNQTDLNILWLPANYNKGAVVIPHALAH
jgi:hypothetical protein